MTRLLLALSFVAFASAALAEDLKRPLSVAEIETLVGSGVSQGRVADVIQQHGVTFELTPALKEQLRAAGAGEQVLGAVDRASLQMERQKFEAQRKAGDTAALEEKKRQAAADATAKKAGADAKKKADRERAKKEGGDAGTRNAESAKAVTKSKGSAPMVMVAVPGGPFFMGCNESVDSECDGNEKPGRTVDVATFKIDKTEVTVAQYESCVDSGACSSNGLSANGECTWQKSGREDHPINCVNWNQALAYCAWAGKRLPTEAEWEKAARGTDGRKYPWGNEAYGDLSRLANITGSDDGYQYTAPVGSFPAGASPSGALDMIGNVWEWTASPFSGGYAVRGAAFGRLPEEARASRRLGGNAATGSTQNGFRCAQSDASER